ncbi:hypothetical protein BDZ94DRAFT_1264978 [Collybia nuda]|uniref:Uncharacterized protein n=1 Tax=Collybia nuda TaxID=64659 RepID=A0A9P5Y480_9AGAR|nr:hypothetical protein BDZ94DRAFT_1264978 [Collybia nuda]
MSFWYETERLPDNAGDRLQTTLQIWRCYILWSRRRVIIAVPSLLALATFGTSIMFAVQYARNNPSAILKASLIVVSLSMATNIIVTVLIT